MKTLSLLSYIIGSILLIVSCFVTGVAATWILGAIAVVFLIVGCVFQYNNTKNERYTSRFNENNQI